jgi:hypothetical protein
MMRQVHAALLAIASMLAVLFATTATAGAAERLDVYVGEVAGDQVGEIVDLGIDRHELELTPVRGERGPKAHLRVEAILSGPQAAALRREGIELEPKRIDGQTVAQRATRWPRRASRSSGPTAGPAA